MGSATGRPAISGSYVELLNVISLYHTLQPDYWSINTKEL